MSFVRSFVRRISCLQRTAYLRKQISNAFFSISLLQLTGSECQNISFQFGSSDFRVNKIFNWQSHFVAALCLLLLPLCHLRFTHTTHISHCFTYISFTYFLWIFFITLTKSFDTWALSFSARVCVSVWVCILSSPATMRIYASAFGKFNRFHFNVMQWIGWLTGWRCSS